MTMSHSAHHRTKHIDIRHHYVKDCVSQQTIHLHWISTEDQIADILTKAVPYVSFNNIRTQLLIDTNN